MTSVETEAAEQAASLHVRVPEPLRDAVVAVAVSEQRSIGSASLEMSELAVPRFTV